LLCSVFFKIDRIHYFNIRYSLFQSFFSDQTGRFSGQRRRSYETTFKKLELDLSCATLHFVGWVEPAPSFVGFRCTQPNLHFSVVIAKCETQQRPISKPSPKSFFFDQTGRFFFQRRR
jgi:hypothetical protein